MYIISFLTSAAPHPPIIIDMIVTAVRSLLGF